MTMHEAFSCQTIRQKSPIDVSVGPCVTMYAFGCVRLCERGREEGAFLSVPDIFSVA